MSHVAHTHDTCALLQAVTMFQSYYGLDLTGRLDDMTMSAVHTPRCSDYKYFSASCQIFLLDFTGAR